MAETAQMESGAQDVSPQVADAPAKTDDLDALLAEFDAAAKPDQPADTAAVQNQREIDIAQALSADAYRVQAEVDSRRSELERAQKEWQAERDQRDGKALVDRIRGKLAASDAVIRGWILAKAQSDARLEEIWSGRETHPQIYEQTVSQLVEEYQAEQTRIAESALATTDRDAVAQAVRGASTRPTAEPPPDFGRMSPDEFHQWKRSNMPGY